MTTIPIKFRNILGKLTISKLYGGEHLGVSAPANFNLRAQIVKIAKGIGKIYQPVIAPIKTMPIPPELQHILPNAFCEYQGQIYRREEWELKDVGRNENRIRAEIGRAHV